eukprot:CAMPEP_0206578156 /NCGR_PEP_ID=MMETSP0325_2-20121206/31791_1 /ASSEMBLY_ACC=CAM_ASM_000347 /TAXON_ID=2866 /ORGANISM="Crypthecodinium cohnii, Strain Seligo" /LENGTH=267 /DNA_ID=CAMNT_0054083733 /DNA_START=45 /DNA_END=850 /DNA_ORIENTATION=+
MTLWRCWGAMDMPEYGATKDAGCGWWRPGYMKVAAGAAADDTSSASWAERQRGGLVAPRGQRLDEPAPPRRRRRSRPQGSWGSRYAPRRGAGRVGRALLDIQLHTALAAVGVLLGLLFVAAGVRSEEARDRQERGEEDFEREGNVAVAAGLAVVDRPLGAAAVAPAAAELEGSMEGPSGRAVKMSFVEFPSLVGGTVMTSAAGVAVAAASCDPASGSGSTVADDKSGTAAAAAVKTWQPMRPLHRFWQLWASWTSIPPLTLGTAGSS